MSSPELVARLSALHQLRIQLLGPQLARTSCIFMRDVAGKTSSPSSSPNAYQSVPRIDSMLENYQRPPQIKSKRAAVPTSHGRLSSAHRRKLMLPMVSRREELLTYYPPDVDVKEMAELDPELKDLGLKDVWYETMLKRELDAAARNKPVRVSGKKDKFFISSAGWTST